MGDFHMRRPFLVLLTLALLVGLALLIAPPPKGAETPGDRPESAPVAGVGDPGLVPPREPGDVPPVPPDGRLTGIVVDEAGAPIGEATISTERAPLRRYRPLEVGVRGHGLMTSPDGTFILGLWPGETVDLRISKAGYATRLLPDCREADDLRIVLSRGATLDVVVTDEGGTGVAGANVMILRADPVRTPVVEFRVHAGEDGIATIPAVSPGPVLVVGWSEGTGTAAPAAHTVPEAGRLQVPVRLPRGRPVRGVVLDVETGKPIAGACVAEHFSRFRAVATDAEGRFALPAWAGRMGRGIFVAAEGYVDQAITPPAEGEMRVGLRPGLSLRGRVMTSDGEPIAGAEAVVLASSRDQIPQLRAATTGEAGRFELVGLLPDEQVLPLHVSARGHGSVYRLVPIAGEPVEIVLGPSRTLSGRVLDREGKLRPGAVVRLGEKAPFHKLSRQECATDARGEFRFAGLGPGTWVVALVDPGAPVVKRDVILPEDRDVTDIVLRPETAGEITVLVVDQAGRPVPGMAITAYGAEIGRQGTGPEGTATFRGLPDEEVSFGVRASRFTPKKYTYVRTVPERPRGQTIRVEVKELSKITGILIGEDDKPIPLAHVAAAVPGERSHRHVAVTDGSGRFVLLVEPGLVVDVLFGGRIGDPTGPGPLEVLSCSGALTGIEAPAEGVTIRAKTIRSDLGLTVRVLGTDGKPLAGMYVSPRSRTGGPPGRTTDAQGTAVFDALREETHLVHVSVFRLKYVPGLVNPEPPELVPAGQTIELRCIEGVEIEGVVLDAGGKPLPRAHVGLNIGDWYLSHNRADASGRFRLTALQGRSHDLTASGKDGWGRKKGVTVGGGPVEVRIGVW